MSERARTADANSGTSVERDGDSAGGGGGLSVCVGGGAESGAVALCGSPREAATLT